MHIDFHKRFKKQYAKLSTALQDKFDKRLKVFIADPFAPELNNHALHGDYLGYRSINVTGDLRAVYEIIGDQAVEFLFIDTHSKLYGN